MIKAKRGKIPPYSLFFLLYISRLIVTLTYVQTISVGTITTDLIISVGISFALVLLLSVPAYLCVKKGITPFNTNWLAIAYVVYFITKIAINVSRFSGFVTSRLNPDSTTYFFSIMLIAAVAYAAYLGIEGLGRFSLFSGTCLIGVIALIIALNFDNFQLINFYPAIKNTPNDIAYNSLIFTSNAVEPAIMLALSHKVNGDLKSIKKAYFGSIAAAYATIFALVFSVMAVLGSNSTLQSYPIFTLFQMATGDTMARLDIIHTATWILAAFLKCSLMVYCSSIAIKKFSHKTKCIVISLISLVLALAMTEWVTQLIAIIAKPFSLATFAIFCFAVPVILLFVPKKNKGGSSVENS